MPAAPSPYILLIDDDDERRLEVLDHLVRRGRRVVACRSADEAREITRHVTHGMSRPDLVIIGERAEREGGRGVRRAFEERFPRLCWITYPPDRDIAWLDELLGGLVEEGRTSGPPQTFD